MKNDIKYDLYEFLPVEFVNRVLSAHIEGTLLICKVSEIDAIVSESNFATFVFNGEEKTVFAEIVEIH